MPVSVPAGYSGKPLAKKLGITRGQRLAFIDPPEGYVAGLGRMPEGASIVEASAGELDLVQMFVKDRAVLDRQLPHLRGRIRKSGMIWISWPKRSSKMQTDVTEDLVRATGLKCGLVDVKICSVDETWSGLRFVIRLKDRRPSLP